MLPHPALTPSTSPCRLTGPSDQPPAPSATPCHQPSTSHRPRPSTGSLSAWVLQPQPHTVAWWRFSSPGPAPPLSVTGPHFPSPCPRPGPGPPSPGASARDQKRPLLGGWEQTPRAGAAPRPDHPPPRGSGVWRVPLKNLGCERPSPSSAVTRPDTPLPGHRKPLQERGSGVGGGGCAVLPGSPQSQESDARRGPGGSLRPEDGQLFLSPRLSHGSSWRRHKGPGGKV